MKELRIFIEERPAYLTSYLHVWDENNVYTIENGQIVATKVDRASPIAGQHKPFVEGENWFIHAFAEALSKYVESKGGVETNQLNKGKIDRFQNEVHWLRALVEKQMK